MATGYQRRDPVSHRKYDRKASIRAYLKSGKFRTVAGGTGHRAGYAWAEAKGIDPDDNRTRKYSKNSPSFDEGVFQYKQAMASKMK